MFCVDTFQNLRHAVVVSVDWHYRLEDNSEIEQRKIHMEGKEMDQQSYAHDEALS